LLEFETRESVLSQYICYAIGDTTVTL